jgi:hypothetical protein
MSEELKMNDTQAVAASKATSSRASDAPITKCFVCEQTLFLSFFFDALGHDRLADLPKNRLSNLSRIFEAHRQTKESVGIHRFYYEGLGTDLRASPGMADAAQKALLETGKALVSEAGGKAAEAVTDKAKAAASGVAQGQSLKLHTQALRKELPGDLRKALTDPSSYVEGVLQSIFSKVVDIFPQFRDNKLVASALNTGAQARIDKALKDFDGVLAAQSMPIRTVQVAVFGAERGASLARAFVNTLIDKRCKEDGGGLVLKKGAKPTAVEFKFVGLFDAQSTVAEFGKEYEVIRRTIGKLVGFATGLIGAGGLRDTFELDLPKQVQRVVHMVAGNETRLIAAVDSLAKSEAMSKEESVYPGSQPDVIGGLARWSARRWWTWHACPPARCCWRRKRHPPATGQDCAQNGRTVRHAQPHPCGRSDDACRGCAVAAGLATRYWYSRRHATGQGTVSGPEGVLGLPEGPARYPSHHHEQPGRVPG